MTRLRSELALEDHARWSSPSSSVLVTHSIFLVPTATVRCCEIERARRRNSQLTVLPQLTSALDLSTLLHLSVRAAFIRRRRSPGYQTVGGNAATSLPLLVVPPPSRVKRCQLCAASSGRSTLCQLYSIPRSVRIPVVKIHCHARSRVLPLFGIMTS